MQHRLVGLALVTIGLLATGSVDAQRAWRPRPMPPAPPPAHVAVEVEGESGARLPTFAYQGQSFVLGSFGQAYAIRLSNQSPGRVEVVVAVDGRDAVSGQPTDLVRHRGYVIPAWGTLRVQGFRNSMDSVATFRFTDPGDAYSSRMGSPGQNGTISVAVYAERAWPESPLATPDDLHDVTEARLPVLRS